MSSGWSKQVTYVVFGVRHTKVFMFDDTDSAIIKTVKEIWNTGYVEMIEDVYQNAVVNTRIYQNKWQPNERSNT